MLQIKGYTIFLAECADGSFYSGMCRDLDKRLKDINNKKVASYFSSRPQCLPIKIVFKEDHVIFKEAFVKHKYLRSLTKRYRDKMVKDGKWPLGKELRQFMRDYL